VNITEALRMTPQSQVLPSSRTLKFALRIMNDRNAESLRRQRLEPRYGCLFTWKRPKHGSERKRSQISELIIARVANVWRAGLEHIRKSLKVDDHTLS